MKEKYKDLPCFYCKHWRRINGGKAEGMNGIAYWKNSSCMKDERNQKEEWRTDTKIKNGICKDFYRATGWKRLKNFYLRLNI